MVAVRINGQDSQIAADGLQRVADLVELIKSQIDPEHMITSILIDGRELSDADWSANTSQYETSIIEIETGTPESFVADRLAHASDIAGSCFFQFRDARKSFQAGNMQEGNQQLIQAVNTLQAFFEWYATLTELVPEDQRRELDISEQVNRISEICKKICQQQLYQSWWALGETLEKELEPELDGLEDFLRKFRPKSAA
ncbi:MAG: hypothetical protein D6719_00990 [Candidatus Dadabacteria bacterium]|nr:MAG: hypothetical protein D6719_00990 [Candidatus Dadabacteria bacterium]